MFQHQTIEQHQLIRKQEELFDDHTYSFTKSFLPIAAKWTSHAIHDPSSHRTLHHYLVSLEAQAYIIATAFLHEPFDSKSRWTDMRLSHMIVDSWFAAGGKIGGLRFFGVNWIINEDALASIHKEFLNVDSKSERKAIMIKGEKASVITSKAGADNPFVKCATRVAEALSGVGDWSITVKTISLIRLASFVIHMMIEFDSEENFVVVTRGNEAVVHSTGDEDSVPKRTPSSQRHVLPRALGNLFRV